MIGRRQSDHGDPERIPRRSQEPTLQDQVRGLGLFAPADPDWLLNPADPIQRDFAAFHTANPRVYARLEGLADRAYAAGVKHLSIRDLWGTLRYTVAVETPQGDYKLNNNYTALYGRLLIHRRPHLASIVELRERSAA